MSYLREHGTRSPVPQSEKLRDDQVENSTGGFVWAVDKWTRLRRFLVLGSEGGSFYASERDLTKENIVSLRDCLTEDGARTVAEIVSVSTEGRAPRNDQAIFALATAVALGDEPTKKLALDALPRVCRIGTHLFMFCDFLDAAYGKLTGRAKRRALAQWYVTPRGDDEARHEQWLANQVVKYRQRGGWSHRDVLRLAHPAKKVSSGNPTVAVSENVEAILSWATHGWPDWNENMIGKYAGSDGAMGLIEGFERVQRAKDADEVVSLIGDYGLPREALPTEHLNDPKVWGALLDAGMPMTAMIRNLGNMSKLGVLTPTSQHTKTVLDALADEDTIRKARVHPFNVLVALKTYASGTGFRGGGSWSPVAKIVDALDAAFYAAFGNVEPTGKRWLIGLDVSGSMGSPMMNTNLTVREGATAMSLITASVEDLVETVAFASSGWSPTNYSRAAYFGGGLAPFPISKRERLDDVVARSERLPFGGTDCALPMLYATKHEREVDVFAIYTDSETWAGGVHPTQALAEYRRQSGIDARLVVVGMVSNGFSIADPKDPGMLDVVGFDTATPNVISEFAVGNI